MSHNSSLGSFLLDRGRRVLLASVGLLLFALGLYLQMQANIGQPPWNALNQGLTLYIPLSFGNVSILVSLTVVACDLLLRESIGLGTILDALLVGWGLDFFLWLDPVPLQTQLIPQLALLLAGLVVVCLSQYLYMKAALSCGPRDALLVALGKRVPRVPIGVVNILLTSAVLLVGFLLGGQVGAGTVITLFGTGIVMEWVFRLLHFEPRNVEHEGLLQTWAAFSAALKGEPTEENAAAPDRRIIDIEK